MKIAREDCVLSFLMRLFIAGFDVGATNDGLYIASCVSCLIVVLMVVSSCGE